MSAPIEGLPAHLRDQLDGKRRRITCSWGEWLDYSEEILSRQNIRRVLLTDWPEIDLPETRREAEISITRGSIPAFASRY